MKGFHSPPELEQLTASALDVGLVVSVDVTLSGDYAAATRVITTAGVRMGKTAEIDDGVTRLRFWRNGVDYGVHAIKVTADGRP